MKVEAPPGRVTAKNRLFGKNTRLNSIIHGTTIPTDRVDVHAPGHPIHGDVICFETVIRLASVRSDIILSNKLRYGQEAKLRANAQFVDN